jgi:DNA repair photolyase
MKKQFKGKAIYNPSGKAEEYSTWACNFYTGCSNRCEYCYCRKGVLSHTWRDTPKLKSCFESEDHALGIFEKELIMNKDELRKHGLFFSFMTDPMLPKTIGLTSKALNICHKPFQDPIPVKILTKCTWWVNGFVCNYNRTFGIDYPELIAFGFTLTGHDELEPGASTNKERIIAMKERHDAGFKTWASIEPIITFEGSLQMILKSMNYCDLFKIGLLSGSRPPKRFLTSFVSKVHKQVSKNSQAKIYWKDSITNYVGPLMDEIFVSRDYNLFEQPEPSTIY